MEEDREEPNAHSFRCEVCAQLAAKYKCPRCAIRTCSLPCVKQHKLRQDCSGVRDKTAYVAMKDFTDLNLLSDYRFLEDADRKSDTARRDTIARRREVPRYLKRVLNQSRQRGIHLKLLPIGMTKRKLNSTFFQERTKTIMWTLEWVFPAAQAKHRDKRAGDIETLRSLLGKYLTPGVTDPVVRHKLKQYERAGVDSLTLVMKVEGRPANSVRYHKLCLDKTLCENLQGKLIVEYPTVFVLLESQPKIYPILGEENSNSSSSGNSSDSSVSSDEDKASTAATKKVASAEERTKDTSIINETEETNSTDNINAD
ncbi:box C/D snoRNA protein 1-like [Lingula anatina]|uniref:Box C/D snoRNA protein 1 n=1 Tax=Lingula anatina TaxID=7574 RepID=A0A1S3JQ11_LINAN|nr:box C/D snoRNA protein 1-like [Lingula anatina]|eukprot:XP_013412241.1 box C/D snoRNA protein 1-like [Lingula anatina]